MIVRIVLMIVEIVVKIVKAKKNKEKTQIFDTYFLFRIRHRLLNIFILIIN